jgi:hypothetical protein
VRLVSQPAYARVLERELPVLYRIPLLHTEDLPHHIQHKLQPSLKSYVYLTLLHT